ncbi:hypothetical protein [Methanolobus sp. WCC4]|uniref:hypothetical protein n=1 Tax=Methanolobus sp. WCC4 TaxID=3125784 RepID=UPI0030F4BDD2
MDDEIQDLGTIEPEDHIAFTEEAQLEEAEPAIINDQGHDVPGSEHGYDADIEGEYGHADDIEGEYESDIAISVDNDDADPGDVKALVPVTDDHSGPDNFEDKAPEVTDGIILVDEDTDLSSIQEEDEKLAIELESRVVAFEERLNEMKSWVESSLDVNGNLISSLGNEIQARADDTEFRQLKTDFDHFSKKLRRVVQAEDSVNAEALDATKVPPDVLEITYAKTLNDLYSAMLEIYGDRESCDMVEDARESVRQFSAGVDFFRFEDETFIVKGLSEAIAAKIVSVKQIHGTYIELFKMLYQHVPNYNSQDFRAFVETGSREYTIEKVVSHEHCLDQIRSDVVEFRDELSHITENVSFMAELQNNHIEDLAGKGEELDEVREQMKAIAKAVNLHTKAINKLNRTLMELKDLPVSANALSAPSEPVEAPDISKIEEMVGSRASREDLSAISGEMESFKASVEEMFISMQQQLEESMLNSQKLKGLEEEISGVHEEIQHLHVAEKSQSVRPVDVPVEDGISGVHEDMPPLYVAEETRPVKLTDAPIEDVITGQLSVLGSATLKQLEKQINEQGFPIDHEKLSLVMSYLEQEHLVNTTKKGRYTFYSVTEPVNA